ncbi:phosphopantothenate--cysteine ligase [soil metagenome]
MNILITAGNTQTPIDRVRVITNVFTGKTGARIATCAWARGHTVTLCTSNIDALPSVPEMPEGAEKRLSVFQYSTFDDLTGLLQQLLRTQTFDAIIHSAAVSDYLVAGTYLPADRSFFNARTKEWECRNGPPGMVERDPNTKMNSREPEMWVRLVRAPKLVDRFKTQWGFDGLLVKFKLEVGLSDSDLVTTAEASRVQSQADLMVANTLEGSQHWAYLGPNDGRYERVPRREMAERLVMLVEHLRRR